MNNGCTFTLVNNINPCSNPHTWSWVVGNDQKRKIVNTSVWNEFLSLEDKGSRATTLARPEETRFSIWPGKTPGGGGGALGMSIREETPGQTLERLERLYLWAGLGMPRAGAGGSSQEEDFPAEAATPVTQTRTDEQCELKNVLIFIL